MRGGQGVCGGWGFTEGCGPQAGGYLDAVAHSWSENRVSDSVELPLPVCRVSVREARWRRFLRLCESGLIAKSSARQCIIKSNLRLSTR